ncbi:hypothetical protein [Janthinobacterium sp. 17J80-10]|uniref:hypothetical protein n=1 Tax=Janthinobacterium sp. 17J80-10 TaxID=2497863 RepID=UPI00100551C6|nr:hypothetical protein [Janthinobacterium sp. 17J80-10]QAU34668.1 hypothetical protein EKL02_11000 [Janthinobacterium sp. 17J80-10]
MSQEIDHREIWDTAIASDLVGKILLVGASYFSADGTFIEQEQFYGRVLSASTDEGIVLELEGSRLGEEFTLPPDTRSIYRAAAGEYKLRSTGEVVVDPDFTATYNVQKHAG